MSRDAVSFRMTKELGLGLRSLQQAREFAELALDGLDRQLRRK